MNEDQRQKLALGLKQLHLSCTPAQQQKLWEYAQSVLSENVRTNLTGARDLSTFITEHVLDSLTVSGVVRLGELVVDLGSGAGVPGIPLAIVHPETNFVLIEPRAKRADYLVRISKTLGLANVKVIKSSALGSRAGAWRGKAESVLVRAVGRPLETFGLAGPLLRQGGQLVIFAGRAAAPNQAEEKKAARGGLRDFDVKRVRVPGVAGERHVWVLTKS